MTLEAIEIPNEYKIDIDQFQNQLKNGIRNHQVLFAKLKENPQNLDIRKSLREWEEKIFAIGLKQNKIFDRLRKEYKNCQKAARKNAIKNGIEEKRINVNNSLARARKQNITVRPTSVASTSSEDSEIISDILTPEPSIQPLLPYDLSQEQFLGIFKLCSHETFKDLQNRRVERKRRSTTNPSFVYTKEWNATTIAAATKRKRASPPNTRASNKTKKNSPPPKKVKSRSTSPIDKKLIINSFPVIPNLPSGLTIERVSPTKSGVCIECNKPGGLSECENCKGSFHVTCHNRPLAQTPRYCPRCHSSKEKITPHSSSSSMSVMCITAETAEKLQEKNFLLEKNKSLTAELTQLQDQHSQLTISLKNQKHHREELLTTQQSTEEKIKKILSFINSMKSPPSEEIEIECS